MGWLNAEAPENIASIVVTLDVLQPVMLPLNDIMLSKVLSILLTLETSQSFIKP